MNNPVFSNNLFWDTNPDNLDYEKHARYIIERELSRGTLEDWYELKKYYGLERIKQEIVQVHYLDKLTLNFCCLIFDIPKEQFRCYNVDPAIKAQWDY